MRDPRRRDTYRSFNRIVGVAGREPNCLGNARKLEIRKIDETAIAVDAAKEDAQETEEKARIAIAVGYRQTARRTVASTISR